MTLADFIKAHARAYRIDQRIEMAVPVGELIKGNLEPVRRGRWIRMRGDPPGDFRCSCCGAIAPINEVALHTLRKIIRYKVPRCMYCGAKMDTDGDSNG